jgi:hypothetical protein
VTGIIAFTTAEENRGERTEYSAQGERHSLSWEKRPPHLDLLADLNDHQILAEFKGTLVSAAGRLQQLFRGRDWGTNVRVHGQARFGSSEYESGLLWSSMVVHNVVRSVWGHAHALENLWYYDFVNEGIATSSVSNEILRDAGVAGKDN